MPMTLLLIAISGLAAGGLHVLAGPDHLAAIAPLAADSRRSVWRAGMLWGVGHTGGVLLVGALALLLRELLPIDAISSWSERIVGVALVAVGLWGLRRAVGVRIHAHEHRHDGTSHVHVHAHGARALREAHDGPAVREAAHAHTHTSFAFGILHGLAGSSHVLGIVPALALPTLGASVVYLSAYGVGNIAAMTGFSAAVGAVAAHARSRGLDVYRGLLTACSVTAVVVGGIWLT
ncbi:MAG: High-affinity nickel transporter [Vicinamibacteraceae bacterium]|nr:High-affinity nickel transporter [Vicinamibacteraceae bacterium]